MDKKEIAAVWQAYLDVQEGKYKKEAKKLDPVGQEDGDIDNDGDEDSSDKYLAKRRKAIGKAMGKDDKEQKEGKIPPQFLKGKDKKDDDKEDDSDDAITADRDHREDSGENLVMMSLLNMIKDSDGNYSVERVRQSSPTSNIED